MAEQVGSLKTGIKYKNTPIGKIPVDWEIKKVIDLAASEKYSYTGGPFGSNLKEDSYTESGVRVIQLQNIGDGKFLDEYKIFTSEEKANQLKNCNIYPGDIIIAKMADPVARACIIPNTDKRYLMASDGIRLSVDREKYDTRFVLFAINSPLFRKKAEKHSTGTTRLRIGLTELRNLLITIPPIKEQKRIAEILSTLDEEIEKTDQIIEKTKEAKKGLMQKLLTRGIGHKKFKRTEIGEIPEEWKIARLGSLTETVTKGTTPTTYGFDFTEAGINFIKVESIGESGDIIWENIPHITEEANKALNRSILKESDILFSIAGALGRVAIVSNNLLPANTNQALAIIRLKRNSEAMMEYIKYYLSGPLIQGYIRKIAVQSAQANLSLAQVNNFLVGLPNVHEQKQVAEILSSIDEEIKKETRQKEQLESLKKGLMQVLLTGKIRVSV
jgi:type I restriction enzyme S subunit